MVISKTFISIFNKLKGITIQSILSSFWINSIVSFCGKTCDTRWEVFDKTSTRGYFYTSYHHLRTAFWSFYKIFHPHYNAHITLHTIFFFFFKNIYSSHTDESWKDETESVSGWRPLYFKDYKQALTRTTTTLL